MEEMPVPEMPIHEDQALKKSKISTQTIELISGEMITSRVPADSHQQILFRLGGELYIALKSTNAGEGRTAPFDLYLDENNIPQPDLLFVSKDNQTCKKLEHERGWQGAPDLIAEVLSPSSAKSDRDEKFALYEQYGVREYWIIDPAHQTIEVFTLQDAHLTRHGVYGIEDKLTSIVLPEWTIEVGTLFQIP